MKWFIKLLFPTTPGRRVRISPDHLPGLKAPTRAPFIPVAPKPKGPQVPTIEDHYANFQASTAGKKKPTQIKKGLSS
jgi:hypothetical protein